MGVVRHVGRLMPADQHGYFTLDGVSGRFMLGIVGTTLLFAAAIIIFGFGLL